MKNTWGLAMPVLMGLLGCQSTPPANQPQFPSQKIYHAPAHLYDFDLSSSALRGELKLKQSCDVTGTSLDILDQLGQQVRLDSFNLNHHPQLHTTQHSTLPEVAAKLLVLYQKQLDVRQIQHSESIVHNHSDALFYRLALAEQTVDLVVLVENGFAYSILLNSPLTQSNTEKSKQQLLTLLQSLFISSSNRHDNVADLAVAFDLSHLDAKVRQDWQHKYCP